MDATSIEEPTQSNPIGASITNDDITTSPANNDAASIIDDSFDGPSILNHETSNGNDTNAQDLSFEQQMEDQDRGLDNFFRNIPSNSDFLNDFDSSLFFPTTQTSKRSQRCRTY